MMTVYSLFLEKKRVYYIDISEDPTSFIKWHSWTLYGLGLILLVSRWFCGESAEPMLVLNSNLVQHTAAF